MQYLEIKKVKQQSNKALLLLLFMITIFYYRVRSVYYTFRINKKPFHQLKGLCQEILYPYFGSKDSTCPHMKGLKQFHIFIVFKKIFD